MLRRRADHTYEFRQVELALQSVPPRVLTPERREALRLRIMAELGPQEAPRPSLPVLRERWIAIPAGVGIAAAIFAGVRVAHEIAPAGSATPLMVAHATGSMLVDGHASSEARPGQLIRARASTWLDIGSDVRVGLEAGSQARYTVDPGGLRLQLDSGDATVVTSQAAMAVSGMGWVANLRPGTVARFALVAGDNWVSVAEGSLDLVIEGRVYTVTPANSPLVIAHPGQTAPAPADPAPTPLSTPVHESLRATDSATTPAASTAIAAPPVEGGTTPAQTPASGVKPAAPPVSVGAPGSPASPSATPSPAPSATVHGQPSNLPQAQPSNGNAAGQGANPGNSGGSNAGGNGNGNGNVSGQSTSPGNSSGSNAGGSGNGNGNLSGQGANPGNSSGSNAGGNGNGNGNLSGQGANPGNSSGSNAGGNGNGNGNVSGQSTSPGNSGGSNAGGNGNGNVSGQSTSPGNSGGGNAGGNGHSAH